MVSTRSMKYPPRVQPALTKILYFIETSDKPTPEKIEMRNAWRLLNASLGTQRAPADPNQLNLEEQAPCPASSADLSPFSSPSSMPPPGPTTESSSTPKPSSD